MIANNPLLFLSLNEGKLFATVRFPVFFMVLCEILSIFKVSATDTKTTARGAFMFGLVVPGHSAGKGGAGPSEINMEFKTVGIEDGEMIETIAKLLSQTS